MQVENTNTHDEDDDSDNGDDSNPESFNNK